MDHYMEIQLSALLEDASGTMVENLLAVADLPGPMRKSILSRAGGNPFFLEEIVRSLIEIGSITQETGTGRWHATDLSEDLQLPDTIQGVIMARVDRLAEEVKGVLRTASVVGRSFLYRVLETISDTERNLEKNLAVLENVDLIMEKQRIPELEYIFKHALAQETVYESILLKTRRELHRQVAQTIENLFADRLEEFFGLLAYHYARAEAREEALGYLLKAGDRAGQLAADGEALAYYHQAISTYEQAFGKSWDPYQRAVLERKIGQALFRRGEHELALEHLKQALSLLGSPLPESTRSVQLATLFEAVQQLILRLMPGLLHKGGGPEAHPGDVESITAYESLLWIDLVGKPDRFLLDALKVLNLSERINHTERLVYAYSFFGGALAFVGRYGLAERYTMYAQALAEKINNPGSLGDVYHVQAVIASWQGQVEKAIEIGERATQLLRKTGFIRDWGNANLILIDASVFISRYAHARQIAEEMIEVGQESGDLQVLAWGNSQRGQVERYTGDPEVSIAEYQKFVDIADKLSDYVSHVEGLAMIAHKYLLLGKVDLALDSLKEANRIFQEYKVIGNRFLSKIRIGFAWAHLLAAENGTKAERKLQLARAARACKSALKSVRSFRPFAAEACRLQGTCDWLHGRKRQARKWWDKGLAISSEIGQPYEQAMIYMEMGERLGDAAYVERAKEILVEIGARSKLV
jgi:tetratricopeptide (TPR) repeat protein